jgi:hypothetical protein
VQTNHFFNSKRAISVALSAALFFALNLAAVPELYDGLLLGLLGITCLLPWFLWHVHPYPFAPIYYTSFLFLLAYPIRTFLVLVFPETALGISASYMPPFDPTTVMRALVIMIIGILVYQLSYYLLPLILSFRVRPSNQDETCNGWRIRIVLLYVSGWLVRAYQITSGNFTTWLQGENFDPTTFTLLTYFSEFCEIAYILVWVLAFKEKKKGFATYLLLGSLVVCEAFFGLTIQGTKTRLVRLVFFPIMAYSLIKFRLPWKTLGMAGCLAVVFVFPFVHAYRDLYTERFGESFNISAQEGLTTSMEAVGGMFAMSGQSGHYSVSDDVPVITLGLAILLNRLHGFDSLVVALDNFPRPFPYLFGMDLITAPIAFIPRAIWPEKPISESSDIFDVQILQSPFSRSSTYPIAEGHMNGGWLGVVLVMFSVATLQWALFFLFYLPKQANPLVISAYIWFFIWVVDVGTWVLPAYTFLVQRIIIFLIVWAIFRLRPLTFASLSQAQQKHVYKLG